MKGKLGRFVEELEKIYGPELASVVLYGSSAAGDETRGSDYNLMIVVHDLTLASLKKGQPLIRNWKNSGQPLPLVVKPDYLESSQDVFPLEFLDMKENHKILYGDNPLEKLTIHKEHLRLQCENEMKSKLLWLREHYLLVGHSGRRLKKMLLQLSPSFFVVFRGILHLMGVAASRKKRDVLQAFREKSGLALEVFDFLLEVREGKKKLKWSETHHIFGELLTSVEKVSNFIDHMHV